VTSKIRSISRRRKGGHDLSYPKKKKGDAKEKRLYTKGRKKKRSAAELILLALFRKDRGGSVSGEERGWRGNTITSIAKGGTLLRLGREKGAMNSNFLTENRIKERIESLYNTASSEVFLPSDGANIGGHPR